MASIETRGSSYRVVWRNNGVKLFLTCATLDLAREAADLIAARRHRITKPELSAILLGEDPNATSVPDAPLLRDWTSRWLPAKTRITPGTRVRYESQLQTRILPVLGDIPVDRITPTDIGRLINSLRAEGLSNSTLTRYYAVLHGALAGAVAEKLREDNPCSRSDFVRDQVADDDTGEESRVYLTSAEYGILLPRFAEDARPLVETLAGTGARWSEATALQVCDIVGPTRSKRPRLWIRRAWKLGEGGRWYLGSTKGRQKRSIEVDDDLHRTLCLMAVGKAEDALLFTAPQGGRLSHSNFAWRRWNPAVVRAARCDQHPPASQAEPLAEPTGTCGDHGGRRGRTGKPCGAKLADGLNRCRSHLGPLAGAVSTCDCPGVLHVRPTPHDLRHTHAAWLFADPDVAPLAISRRLGHANLATTSEIYGGLDPSAEGAAVSAIAAATAPGAAGAGRSGTEPR
jgi:integrase